MIEPVVFTVAFGFSLSTALFGLFPYAMGKEKAPESLEMCANSNDVARRFHLDPATSEILWARLLLADCYNYRHAKGGDSRCYRDVWVKALPVIK